MRLTGFCLVCVGWMLVLASPQAGAGTYQVGAAAVDITPKVAPEAPPVWLAGYGVGRQAERVHDPIYARAMYINDGKFGLAVVACDLVGLFNDEVVRIRREIAQLQLSPSVDYVLVSSTHTHAGPDTIGIWGPLGRTGLIPGYLERVRGACVQAIREAHDSARPARLRIATADANKTAQLIGDSRLPRVIDSNLTIIQAKDEAGRTIVTFVNMPCHPEVLGGGNKQLSSDFPSTERLYLEEKFGGVAVHDTGSIGGLLSPREPRTDPFTHEPLPEDGIGKMMAYGRIIGRIVERALANAQPLSGPISVASREVLIPVWNQVYKIAMGMGSFQRQVVDAEGRPIEIPKATTTSSASAREVIKDAHLKTEVGLIQIGPLQIAAIPGEIYPEITLGRYQRPQEANADFPGAPLEPTIFPLMTGKYKMVIGLANDEIGYIIPKSQWDWFAPYAYGRKERQYGEFNSCGPEVAPRIMAAWKSLITSSKSTR
jgi:hypothetical protein